MDTEPFALFTGGAGRIKYLATKWLCGVDKAHKPPKLTKEELRNQIIKNTDIKEDPFWKRVLDINAIICAAVAVFLHAFWA